LLITGTPLQNNLAELWSLLNFLMPDIFDELDAFESWFDFSALKDKEAGHRQILVGERKNQIVSSLHAILKPFLLRRVKADVEAALPKKREYILYAPLTLEQRELYRHICQGDSRAYLEQLVLRQILDGRAAGSPKSDEQHGAGRKRKAANDGVATPTKSVKSSRASTPLSRHGRSRFGKKRVEYREKDDDEYFRDLEQGGSRQDANDVEVDPEEAEMAKAIAMASKSGHLSFSFICRCTMRELRPTYLNITLHCFLTFKSSQVPYVA
jgi:ATP-dependent DNA helicase